MGKYQIKDPTKGDIEHIPERKGGALYRSLSELLFNPKQR